MVFLAQPHTSSAYNAAQFLGGFFIGDRNE